MNKILNSEKLKESLIKWFQEEISINKVNTNLELTCPFLDRYNDYLQIYIKHIDEKNFILSDDGYIIENLKMSGIDMSTNRRQEMLQKFIKKYAIELRNNELSLKTDYESFPQKSMLLMQAMLNIDDMFMLSQNKIVSFFLEDVVKFFSQNEIFYSNDIKLTGKSGFVYQYDFLLQRNKRNPERLCKLINNPSKQNMESTLFAWNDTKETREQDSRLIVFLNDINGVDINIIEGYKNYNVIPFKWSEREKNKNLVA